MIDSDKIIVGLDRSEPIRFADVVNGYVDLGRIYGWKQSTYKYSEYEYGATYELWGAFTVSLTNQLFGNDMFLFFFDVTNSLLKLVWYKVAANTFTAYGPIAYTASSGYPVSCEVHRASQEILFPTLYVAAEKPMLYFNFGTGTFRASTATVQKARLIEYKGYLLNYYTSVSGSVGRIYWNNLGSAEDWTTGTSGFLDMGDHRPITFMAKYRDELFAYSPSGEIFRLDYVGYPKYFEPTLVTAGVYPGVLNADSILGWSNYYGSFRGEDIIDVRDVDWYDKSAADTTNRAAQYRFSCQLVAKVSTDLFLTHSGSPSYPTLSIVSKDLSRVCHVDGLASTLLPSKLTNSGCRANMCYRDNQTASPYKFEVHTYDGNDGNADLKLYTNQVNVSDLGFRRVVKIRVVVLGTATSYTASNAVLKLIDQGTGKSVVGRPVYGSDTYLKAIEFDVNWTAELGYIRLGIELSTWSGGAILYTEVLGERQSLV